MSILCYALLAYLALIAVQIPLSVLLYIAKHRALGTAIAISIYSVTWPWFGYVFGFIVERIGIFFAIIASISQFIYVAGKDVTYAQISLVILSFFVCFTTAALIIPCRKELNRSYPYVIRRHEIRPPTPIPTRHNNVLIKPAPAKTVRNEWVTVISPNNRIDMAKLIPTSSRI
jgi:hypothetical protein